VKNGVPWLEVWDMDEAEVIAAMVVFAGFEGTKFSWHTMRWEAR
jgi:hypothetical protein